MMTGPSRLRKIARFSRQNEEGSALVELALSLPMLFLILLGSEELARLAYTAIEATNAAHAAALYAASSSAASSDTTGMTNAALADAGNLKGTSAVSVISAIPTCTCSNTNFTPSSCSDNVTCESKGAGMITTVTVTTQAKFFPLFPVPGNAPSYTVQGRSAQVVSNQ